MTVTPIPGGHSVTVECFVSTGRWLKRSWFVICPPFTLLIGRTLYERACVGLTEPWPWLIGRAWLAFLVGSVYVLAHWWCIAWYLTASGAARPSAAVLAASAANGRPNTLQVTSMLLLLAIEYAPLTPWRWLLSAIGC